VIAVLCNENPQNDGHGQGTMIYRSANPDQLFAKMSGQRRFPVETNIPLQKWDGQTIQKLRDEVESWTFCCESALLPLANFQNLASDLIVPNGAKRFADSLWQSRRLI
jgi:hypothetical protein